MGRGIIFSHGTTNSKGVAVLIPKSLEYELMIKITFLIILGILLDCAIKDNNVILINIYAPTKDKLVRQLNFIHTLKQPVDHGIGHIAPTLTSTQQVAHATRLQINA